MTYQLIHGDCLEVLPGLQAGSVDAVICDPPYGTTACAWDTVIPFDAMWTAIKHVVKPSAAVVLFGSQPFTSALVMSNPQWFRYQWIWDKVRPSGLQIAKYRPMMRHEDVCIFGSGSVRYIPEMVERKEAIKGRVSSSSDSSPLKYSDGIARVYTHRFPQSIVVYPKPTGGLHPTQKPVELLRYLIRTYTNPGDTVLDFTMGSGSTIVAAIMEGRSAIGIEIDAGYFAIAQRRCADAAAQPRLLDIEPAPLATQASFI